MEAPKTDVSSPVASAAPTPPSVSVWKIAFGVAMGLLMAQFVLYLWSTALQGIAQLKADTAESRVLGLTPDVLSKKCGKPSTEVGGDSNELHSTKAITYGGILGVKFKAMLGSDKQWSVFSRKDPISDEDLRPEEVLRRLPCLQ